MSILAAFVMSIVDVLMDATTNNSVLSHASPILALLENWVADDVMQQITSKYGGRVSLIALYWVAVREQIEWLTSLPDDQLSNPMVVNMASIKDAIQLRASIISRVSDDAGLVKGVYADTPVANAVDVISNAVVRLSSAMKHKAIGDAQADTCGFREFALFKGGALNVKWTDSLEEDSEPDVILAHFKSAMQPVIEYDKFFESIERGLAARTHIDNLTDIFGTEVFECTSDLNLI